jgi:hypothetical protein
MTRHSLLVALLLTAALGACSGEAAEAGGSGDEGAPTASAAVPAFEEAPPEARDDDESPGDEEPAAPAPEEDKPPPTPTDAFFEAPAYVATLGPSTRRPGHNFNNATPRQNPAGRSCLNCHDGNGGAPQFSAAGTVYAGSQPAARVEVRAIDDEGKIASVYTDADGNFFFPGALDLAFPALVGARNATTTLLMKAPAPNGNCNQCHRGGNAGRLSL